MGGGLDGGRSEAQGLIPGTRDVHLLGRRHCGRDEGSRAGEGPASAGWALSVVTAGGRGGSDGCEDGMM